ncbi:MAG: fatty acid desaturase [Phycisphaerae bacterium]|nr:fatty acid desaturase [Phycisphaerae bacterium]
MMREPKQLLLDSREFAVGDRGRSWWYLLSTGALLLALVAFCLTDWHWSIRLPASILIGLTLVRLFIIYHDHQHGTFLPGSRIAGALMGFYGLATLNPPSIWARSHNHHHKNNAKIFGAAIGSYPVMTTGAWDRATRGQRIAYLVQRHPLTIAAGYLTIFLYGMTIRSLINNPREHWDSAISLAVHAGLITLACFIGVDVMLLVIVIPCAIGSAIGSYLFYAQHNYPDMKIRDRSEWDYVYAALHSSSYIPMNPVMAWFTGNIGYHHVHHLNHQIPFYNLPAAMAEFEELQNPGRTTLWPWDIARCLRLKLWDSKRDRLITLAEHRRHRAEAVSAGAEDLGVPASV